MKPSRMTIKDFPDSILIHSTEYLTKIEEGYGANCHGYTISGEHKETSNWWDVIKYSEKLEDKKILLYTYKHNVSHSGRIEGEVLIHYLKRVGVVSTPLAIARQIITEYKDNIFTLPIERVQFNQLIKKQRLLMNSVIRNKYAGFDQKPYSEH